MRRKPARRGFRLSRVQSVRYPFADDRTALRPPSIRLAPDCLHTTTHTSRTPAGLVCFGVDRPRKSMLARHLRSALVLLGAAVR
jgi:hypothetical protein